MQPRARQCGLDPAQEPRELAEDERAVALGGELAQLVDEEVDLGRGGLVGVGRVDEGRVEGELTQPGEGGEDGDAVGLGVLEQAEHPLTLALQVPVVDVPVHRVGLERQHLDLLRRQVERHLLLGAAQHERPDASTQEVEQLGSLARLDRLAVALREDVGTRVEAGRGEREQRPEVHEGVLEGRARHRHGEGSSEPAHREVGLGLPVLDELGLVEDDPGPPHGVEGRVVEAEDGIRGDDDLGTRDDGREAAPRACAPSRSRRRRAGAARRWRAHPARCRRHSSAR